jgi:hypothetical protein
MIGEERMETMRDFTPTEKALLDRRTAGFPTFIDDMPELVAELAKLVRTDLPKQDDQGLRRLLENTSTSFRDMDLRDMTKEDEKWMGARIGALIGEFAIARHHGFWITQADVENEFFGRYVIRAQKRDGTEFILDPFMMAKSYLAQPSGRDLVRAVESMFA